MTLEEDNLSLRMEGVEISKHLEWRRGKTKMPVSVTPWSRLPAGRKLSAFSREDISVEKNFLAAKAARRGKGMSQRFLGAGYPSSAMMTDRTMITITSIWFITLDPPPPPARQSIRKGLASYGELVFRLTISTDWVSEQISLAELRGLDVFGEFCESLWVIASASCPPNIFWDSKVFRKKSKPTFSGLLHR